MFEQYRSSSQITDIIPKLCPVCSKLIVSTSSLSRYSNNFACSTYGADHQYNVKINNFKYSVVKYYVSQETLSLPGYLNIQMYRDYGGKDKLCVMLYETNRYKPLAKYKLSTFRKLFRPDDTEYLKSKLTSVQKALVLK